MSHDLTCDSPYEEIAACADLAPLFNDVTHLRNCCDSWSIPSVRERPTYDSSSKEIAPCADLAPLQLDRRDSSKESLR